MPMSVKVQPFKAPATVNLYGGFQGSMSLFLVDQNTLDELAWRWLNDKATPAHLRAFVYLGLYTGQRGHTIRKLRWEHVDYDEGMLWFTRTDPKAASNKRLQDMPMTPRLAAFLAAIQQSARTPWVIEYRDNGATKANPEGKPLGPLKTAWAALLKRAGLSDVNIHDLRRSAASFALNAGAGLSNVAAFLNDDERTTRMHYAHADPDLLLAVVKLIEGDSPSPAAAGADG